MRAYTYILRCADGTLYCGWTNDLTARLAAHNSGRGAKYTRGRGPVTLAYSELFGTQGEAMRREAALKRLPRPQKLALIQSQADGELLTIYDADGRPCGDRPRAVVHAQGLFHHVCHLWTASRWDGTPGLWLQQRAFDRPLYPGRYDLSSTGHIDPGETPEAAVLREAREEIGLDLSPDSLVSGGSYRQRYPRGESGGFDDELAFAFLTRLDGIPAFSPGSEVVGMAFVPLDVFAAAYEGAAPLMGRRADGSRLTIPHENLCCLHDAEWKGVRSALQTLLAPESTK